MGGKALRLGVSQCQEKLSKTFGEGTFVYSAPEIFPQAPSVKSHPQIDKADVYGYGVLLCEVIQPEDTKDVRHVVEQVKSLWPYMHSLITSCTAWKYTDRPTMNLNKTMPSLGLEQKQ